MIPNQQRQLLWVVIWIVVTTSNAWLAPSEKYQRKHVLRDTTISKELVSDVISSVSNTQEHWWMRENVRTISYPLPHARKNPWNKLVPPTPWAKVLDVSLDFVDAHEGAVRLASSCFSSHADSAVVSYLEQSFLEFQKLVRQMCPTLPEPRFKARIVATRGPLGTKCPRWHFDHVPVRWIQSLVGPGCDYVLGDEGINRNALNGLDYVDLPVQDINDMMVSPAEANAQRGKEGEAVVTIGNGWNDDSTNVAACVHKSPNLQPFEGRVLLTLDVVMPNSCYENDQ